MLDSTICAHPSQGMVRQWAYHSVNSSSLSKRSSSICWVFSWVLFFQYSTAHPRRWCVRMTPCPLGSKYLTAQITCRIRGQNDYRYIIITLTSYNTIRQRPHSPRTIVNPRLKRRGYRWERITQLTVNNIVGLPLTHVIVRYDCGFKNAKWYTIIG